MMNEPTGFSFRERDGLFLRFEAGVSSWISSLEDWVPG